MKVLLRQTIDTLGQVGDVVDVARGYANNYLIPKGLAIGVTRGRLKEIEESRKVLEVKAARERETFEEVAERIRSESIVITARAGEGGKLYGSVTPRDLAKRISEMTGLDIDRKKIKMDEHVKTLGTHPVRVRLHPGVEVDLEFEVVPEGEPEAAVSEEGATEAGSAEAVSAEVETPGESGEAEEDTVVEEAVSPGAGAEGSSQPEESARGNEAGD